MKWREEKKSDAEEKKNRRREMCSSVNLRVGDLIITIIMQEITKLETDKVVLMEVLVEQLEQQAT